MTLFLQLIFLHIQVNKNLLNVILFLNDTTLYHAQQNKTKVFGFGFTLYEQSLLSGVQSINRLAGSSNYMSCGGNQEAHSGFVDDILEEHFSISLHHKRLVEARKIRQTENYNTVSAPEIPFVL